MSHGDDRDETHLPGSFAKRLPNGFVFAERYRIEATVGRGGMGVVYRAHDLELDEVVALKVLTVDRDEALSRFRREVTLARRITHPNVARTFDIGRTHGITYLTMEYVEGKPLSQSLEDVGRLPIDIAVRVMHNIASGLMVAHEAGVIHRDLKPANILVDRAGRAVLTDFGIARAIESITRTRDTGALIGTPHYMSPEQASGERGDERSDIYAMGLILYELTTGQLPFGGDSPLAIAIARLHTTPDDPRTHAGLPDALAELILSCLALSPELRPSAMRDVRNALASIAGMENTEELAPPGRLFAPITVSGKAIAVLPFQYRGPDELRYLGDEMAEELIDLLSRTRDVTVLALGATRPYAESRDPAQIGRALDVESVIDGTVALTHDRVKITVRLLDTNAGVQRFSERFEGSIDDVLTLQETLSQRIAETLRLEMQATLHGRTAPRRSIEAYMRARRMMRTEGPAGSEAALSLFIDALREAPNFQPAIAGLAIAAARAWWNVIATDDRQIRERAERYVREAIETAPNLAETQLAFAMLSIQLGRLHEGVRALRRALEVAPTMVEAHSYLGWLQIEAGKEPEGRRRLELTLQLDPTFATSHLMLGRSALFGGDETTFARHLTALRESQIAQTVPSLAFQLRWALMRSDRPAMELLERQLARIASVAWMSEALRTVVFDRDLAGAERLVRRIAPQVVNRRLRPLFFQIAAEMYLAAGAPDQALSLVRIASESMFFDLDWMLRNPLVLPLHEHDAFWEAERVVRERAASLWSTEAPATTLGD